MTQPDTSFCRRFIMSPDTLGKRLACKYPSSLWEDVNGVITCPKCGDTLNVFYVWQIVLLVLWFLDMGLIYGF